MRNKLMEPTQEEEGAYHEAGHAALILHFGGEVVTATAMLTSSRCAGMFKAGELMYYESLERVHQHIQIMSAGYFAVALYYKDITDMEAALMTGNRDLRTVSDLQRRFQISGEVMAKLEADAKSLVKQLWPGVLLIRDGPAI